MKHKFGKKWLKTFAIVIIGMFFFQQIAWTGVRGPQKGIEERPMQSFEGKSSKGERGNELLNQFEPIKPNITEDLPIGRLRKIAIRYLKDTVNPDEFELGDWESDGKVASFVFKLLSGSPLTISVRVDDGKVLPNTACDAALKTREYIAGKTGKDIRKVHINGITALPAKPGMRGYAINARVDNITLSLDYVYDRESSSYKLTSLVNNETGVDLLQNAIDYLKERFDSDKYELANWSLQRTGKTVTFAFRLKDGSMAGFQVNIETGKIGITWHAVPGDGPQIPYKAAELPGLEDDTDTTRGDSDTSPRTNLKSVERRPRPKMITPRRRPAVEAVTFEPLPGRPVVEVFPYKLDPAMQGVEAVPLEPDQKEAEAAPIRLPRKRDIEAIESVPDSALDSPSLITLYEQLKNKFKPKLKDNIGGD